MDPVRQEILTSGFRNKLRYQDIGRELGISEERVRYLLSQLRLINKPCIFPGCSNHGYTAGFCPAHYQQKLAHGKLKPLKRKVLLSKGGKRICKFSGCGRPFHAKGYCCTHYRQYLEGKEIFPIKTRPIKICCFPDCSKPYYKSGFCRGHKEQLYRGQMLRPLRYRTPRND